MTPWVDYELPFIRQRYDRIAPFFPLFEWLFLLPPGIRGKTVARLELKPGGRVLEVGCGTGRNLSRLVQTVGTEGEVYGVDFSAGMLAKARELCSRRAWRNVTLVHADAADYAPPQPVDAALFSLSYATMPHHRKVLHHVWQQLRPGGSLVIMDAQLLPGPAGRLARPAVLWTMRHTVLGNPDILPVRELEEVAGHVEVEELALGSYFICRARKNADGI